MQRFLKKTSLLQVLSGLFTNLAAGAVGLIIFTPNFIPLESYGAKFALTYDTAFAIIFLFVAVKLDELSKI